MVALGVVLLGKLECLRRTEFDAKATALAPFDVDHEPADDFLRLNLSCRHVSKWSRKSQLLRAHHTHWASLKRADYGRKC